MMAVRPVIAPNGVRYLEMRVVRSQSTSGLKKEGRREMRGRGGIYLFVN